MKIAKIFLVSAVALILCIPAFSRQKKFGHKEFFEKIRAQKLEFILESLSLEDAAAAKFTALYKSFDDKRGQAMMEQMKVFHKLSKAVEEKKDEDEIVRLTKAYMEAQIRFQEFQSGILEEFSEILNAEQLAKLLIAEEVFRREQFRKMEHRSAGAKSREFVPHSE